uniref:Uncharacterized protein n=1 Tax=Rhizophora mucronata TaxID=61149 RepID=A0A2P2P370_RHIMU
MTERSPCEADAPGMDGCRRRSWQVAVLGLASEIRPKQVGSPHVRLSNGVVESQRTGVGCQQRLPSNESRRTASGRADAQGWLPTATPFKR